MIRRHRLLKTRGTVVRFDGEDEHGSSRAWVKWDHPTTLPNPSLESVDDIEQVLETQGSDGPLKLEHDGMRSAARLPGPGTAGTFD